MKYLKTVFKSFSHCQKIAPLNNIFQSVSRFSPCSSAHQQASFQQYPLVKLRGRAGGQPAPTALS